MQEITWKYIKPLTDVNVILDFEKKAGIVIPDDLKSVIQDFNNGRPSPNCFDLQNEKEKVFKKLLSFNISDVENVYECMELDTVIEGLIPIASDSFGNFICLHQGKIYYWHSESDQKEFLANTFTDFLNKLY